jgi:hypothetical protein
MRLRIGTTNEAYMRSDHIRRDGDDMAIDEPSTAMKVQSKEPDVGEVDCPIVSNSSGELQNQIPMTAIRVR